MPAPDQQDKSVAGATMMAAAAFAIALILTIFFAWHQGSEVTQPNAPAAQAVAPQAQITPDTRGNAPALQRPAPPDATGAGPGQNAAR